MCRETIKNNNYLYVSYHYLQNNKYIINWFMEIHENIPLYVIIIIIINGWT